MGHPPYPPGTPDDAWGAPLSDVQTACDAFFAAHAQFASLVGEADGFSAEALRPDWIAVGQARIRRSAALRIVRSHEAKTLPDLRAKIRAALLDAVWGGCENPDSAHFVTEVLREVATFLATHGGAEVPPSMHGPRTQWFDRFPLLAWFASEQRPMAGNGGPHSQG